MVNPTACTNSRIATWKRYQLGPEAPLAEKRIWDSKVLVLGDGTLLLYSLAAHQSFDQPLEHAPPSITNLYHRNAYVECFRSDDGGESFYEQGPVLARGAPGSFDDERIWTVDVIYRKNTYYMFYTAGSVAGGHRQSIGLAVSQDGLNFSKVKEILTPESLIDLDLRDRGEEKKRYAPSSEDDGEIMALRDPNLVFLDHQWWMLFATKVRSSCGQLKPAIGRVLLCEKSWEVKGVGEPLLLPDLDYRQLEVPLLLAFDNNLYLSVSAVGSSSGKARYFSLIFRSESSTIDGRFVAAGGGNSELLFAPDYGVFAVSPYRFKGKTYGMGFYIDSKTAYSALTSPFPIEISSGTWRCKPAKPWRVIDMLEARRK